MIFLGELAALTTAFCWSAGTILFTAAGRRIGSYNVNKIRLPIAAIYLTILLLAIQGTLLPTGLTWRVVCYLSLSGFIGLVIGDNCYFRCLVILGPRRGALMQALAPPMTALAAFWFLDERLSLLAIVGIAITLTGITWVTTDRRDEKIDAREGSKLIGIMMGICAAAGQAIGLVLAKEAMGATFNPLSATFIRMISAALFIWLIAAARGEVTATLRSLADRKARYALMGAALAGPTLGVWMSLVAVKHTAAGVAATIMSTFPVIVIPLTILIHHDRPTYRSIIGAVVAVIGVALLFID